MWRLILCIILSIFIASCNNKKVPKGILQNREMVFVLTDIHLIDSYVSTSGNYNPAKQPVKNYYKAIYNRYLTDSAQFQKSLRYYSSNPKVLDTIYHQVLQRLNQYEKMEIVKELKKSSAQKLLRLQKSNAEIFLKPEPNWFFRVDAFDLYTRSKSGRPVPLAY